jgi:hypothetical protein
MDWREEMGFGHHAIPMTTVAHTPVTMGLVLKTDMLISPVM